MQTLLLIGLGGMAGAILRHGAVTAVNRITDSPFPWGTLAVNVAGSLALGVLMVLTERMQAGPALRRFAGVGLIGAFTTFSAFSWEVVTLVKDGAWVRAAAYTELLANTHRSAPSNRLPIITYLRSRTAPAGCWIVPPARVVP